VFSGLEQPSTGLLHISQRFSLGSKRHCPTIKGFKVFAIAVWTGQSNYLPEQLRDFYKEGGLLHILALSGQHVSALVLVLCEFYGYSSSSRS